MRQAGSARPTFHCLLLKEETGQLRPVGDLDKWVGLAVPGLGEEDGGDAVVGQLQAGFQAVFHEVLDAVVLEVVDLGVGVARGQDPDGGRRHRGQVMVQPLFDGPPPVPGGDEEQRHLPGQAG